MTESGEQTINPEMAKSKNNPPSVQGANADFTPKSPLPLRTQGSGRKVIGAEAYNLQCSGDEPKGVVGWRAISVFMAECGQGCRFRHVRLDRLRLTFRLYAPELHS